MRAIHAVILLGALGAGCGPAGSGDPSPEPSAETSPEPTCVDQKVTITFGKNPDHPNGPNKCDVMAVVPDDVEVCQGSNITWEFVNDCGKEVEAKIGNRRPKYPKGKKYDPLMAAMSSLTPSPYPIPVSAGGVVTSSVSGTVNNVAPPGLYKYDIEGTDVATDPEIDVRRGRGGMPPPPPPQELQAPSSAPSPPGPR